VGVAGSRVDPERFHPEAVQAFRIGDLEVDRQSGRVRLGYRFDEGPGFVEELDFGPRRVDDPNLDEGFVAALGLLHVVAGVSYYKAALAPVVELRGPAPSPGVARLLAGVYDQGLRELKFRSGLEVGRAPTFSTATSPRSGASAPRHLASPPAGLGVPVGGGKDSALVVAALREHRPVLVSVNPPPAARRVAEAAGLPLAEVRRRLDPALLDLNRRGAWNGHVPVTVIVALISVAAGYRLGYGTTVLALEASANEPTRVVPGPAGELAVNHQWSKSEECEGLLATALTEVLGPGVAVRSALRGWSELEIGAAFAQFPAYHRAFLSCNRAFVAGGEDRWCGTCPKCRFVFLSLAVSLPPEQLVAIFGRNLLDDPEQIAGFEDLLEPDRKPFECVGTRQESAAALAWIAGQPGWSGAAVVRSLAPRAGDLARAAGQWPLRMAPPAAVVAGIRRELGLPDGGSGGG
jgi:hypothetical protein